MAKVIVFLPNHWLLKGESLWAEDLGQERYRIRNIPLCAYNLNLDDVVHAVEPDEDSRPEIRAIIERSGNQTLRVIISAKERTDAVVHTLETLGLDWTSFSKSYEGYVAFNIPPRVNYDQVVGLLVDWEKEGILSYESCEARIPNSFDSEPES